MQRIRIKNHSSIEELFNIFITSCRAKGLSKETINTYNAHFRAIAHHIDVSQDINSISGKDIENMIAALRECDLSSNTIRSYTKTLKAFFNWAAKSGYKTIIFPVYKSEEVIQDTYTDAELLLLLKKPNMSKCSFPEYRTWVMINFFLNSGCRSATILSIKNSDIDIERKLAYFRHTKNRTSQYMPLCTLMAEILTEYMKIRGGRPDDYLFCNIEGCQLSHHGLTKAMQTYNRKRGVHKHGLHMYRHTFAKKYLLDCNGNALALQKILNHQTLEMTKHYCSIFNSDLQKDFDKHSPLENLVPRPINMR